MSHISIRESRTRRPTCSTGSEAALSRHGRRLVTTRIPNSITRGLAGVGESEVAVCLLSGTEVAFDRESKYEHMFRWCSTRSIDRKVARFRQRNMYDRHMQHDVLEFHNGKTVLVTRLIENQTLTVLQLPVTAAVPDGKGAAQRGPVHPS
jgi:hypothetical protein